VQTWPLDLVDPTDYGELYRALNDAIQTLQQRHQQYSPDYWVALASGTPQMQTVWVLLVQSGLLPATLLQVRAPRFVVPGQPAVYEVRLTLENFPTVLSPPPVQRRLALAEQQKEELRAERDALRARGDDLGIVGPSEALCRVVDQVRRIAPYDEPVLITGETGTGKELVARALHALHPQRQKASLIVVNCGALPENLVEAELFGYEKGAFTGAEKAKRGQLELAHRGTLLLDEIGDLPLPTQVKLLRFLQSGEIRRLGSEEDRPRRIDTRVVAATHQPLPALIREGKFREDLYYRLNVIPLEMPPLRERPEDLPPLTEHFLAQLNQAYRKNKRLSPAAHARLQEYSWPGNVRELENLLRRWYVMSEGPEVLGDLPPEGRLGVADRLVLPAEGVDVDALLKNLEESLYHQAITRTGGNLAAAARLLKVQEHTFRARLRPREKGGKGP
jgi:DNA-binding NtrC family response regulator